MNMSPRLHARSRRFLRAFTAIEVILSLTFLAIGTAGIISMERSAIQANVDARRMDMANSIAHLWLERLRRDAMLWTLPDAANPAAAPATVPLLFASDGTFRPALRGAGAWHRPVERIGETPIMSPGVDLQGREIATASLADALFCTNVRLTWLTPAADPGELIRAEVRVFWPRGLETAPDADYCTADPDAALTDNTAAYHFVYAVTALRKNTVPAQ